MKITETQAPPGPVRRAAARRRVVGVATVAVLLMTTTALADTIRLDESTVVREGNTDYLDVTTSTSTVTRDLGYRLHPQASNGCEVSSADPGTLVLGGLPAGVTISAGATFTSCSTTAFQTVTLSVAPTTAAGSYAIAPRMSRQSGGGAFTVHANADFTLRVAAGATGPDCSTATTPAAPSFAHAPDGDNGWYVTTPTVSASSSGATVTYGTTAGGAHGPAPSLGEGQTTVYAIATGPAPCSMVSSESSQTYKVDLGDPYDVTWAGGPADGGSYPWGSVPAAPTCDADDDVSGLDDCVVTGHNAAVGSHVLTATATDNAGRTATATRSYTVTAWTIEGFRSPVSMDVLNVVKGGRTIPLKFEVFAGATERTALTDISHFKVYSLDCSSNAVVGDGVDVIGDTELTSGRTQLRYDATEGQFIQNWQTPKVTADTCFKVEVRTADGSSISVNFKLTR